MFGESPFFCFKFVHSNNMIFTGILLRWSINWFIELREIPHCITRHINRHMSKHYVWYKNNLNQLKGTKPDKEAGTIFSIFKGNTRINFIFPWIYNDILIFLSHAQNLQSRLLPHSLQQERMNEWILYIKIILLCKYIFVGPF